MPVLRPEVVVPIQPVRHRLRSLLFATCAFMMVATAADAVRWSHARREAVRAQQTELRIRAMERKMAAAQADLDKLQSTTLRSTPPCTGK